MLPDHPAELDSSVLEEAIEQLAGGNCVAIPTETVYGLAADATNGLAVARIFEMKGRPKFNPLICHVSDLDMAETLGVFDDTARKLAMAFWPGPLTLVVPLNPQSDIHPLVTANLGTIGLRCPTGVASSLIRDFGKPLAAPSANRSGKLSPTTADHVRSEFPDKNLLIIDGPPCNIGIESTIVKVEDRKLTLLRPGSVTVEQITECCGIEPRITDSGKIEAPGMLKSHYAPDAKVIMNCSTDLPSAGYLMFGPEKNSVADTSLNLSPTGNLLEAAANLYSYLKELDSKGIETICVSPIPNEGLGIAINDRLQRAAAPRQHS